MLEPRISRWFMLFAASGMIWGIYFIYDIPASLSVPLQSHLRLSDKQNSYLVSALYTAYAVPNFVLPFISGFAAQKYGEKRILVMSLLSVIIGQLCFVTALHSRSRSLMIFGRVMIGMGGEVPGVIASDIVTRWFHEEHLALALAILLGVSRLGSVATSILTPRLTVAHGVVFATWASTTIALLVSIPCVIYVLAKDAAQLRGGTKSNSRFQASLRRFPRIFWLLGLICVAFYGCYGPFNNSAIRFLASRFYRGDQEVAGIAVSIPNVLSGILVLPFGLLLEHPRFKFYPVSLLFSSALIVAAHTFFLVQIGGATFPLCLLGVAYALFGVAFWPAVACSILQDSSTSHLRLPLLDDESEESFIPNPSEPDNTTIPPISSEPFHAEVTKHVSAANEDLVVIGYGILTSFLNLSMGIVPVLLAVMEVWAGYPGLEMVFVGLSAIALSACVRLVSVWRD